MKKNIRFRFLSGMAFALLAAVSTHAQQPRTYALYDGAGTPVSYAAMVSHLSKSDMVFVGEYHNCPLSHWMEMNLLKSLHAVHKDSLKVGMEMFERDIQPVIDEYFAGTISYKFFESDTRPWPNYDTDYSPLVDYARENGLRLVATNVARRYAAIVSKKGLQALDSLSEGAKATLPPLPIPYRSSKDSNAMFSVMGSMMGSNTNAEYMSQAQALKDATMAYSILENMPARFIHFNGTIHSDRHDGIVRYIRLSDPKARIATVTTVKQEQIDRLEEEYLHIADYIICVADDFPTSY